MTARTHDRVTPPPLGSRAGFGGLLAYGMAMATLPQFAIGALAPFLTADLGLSRSRLGGLTTALFVAAALCSPSAGRIVDALGARRLLVALFAGAGLAFAGMAASPSYALLLASIAVAGAAMAVSNPATNRLIAEHAARGSRGVLVGVKQSGVQAGAFFAGVALPSAAVAFGWRGALLVGAALAVVGMAVTLPLVPPDPPAHRLVGRRDRPPLDPVVRWLALYACFMGAGVACIGAFLPLYATDALGMNATSAGLVAALLGLVGVVARIAWARAADGRVTVTRALTDLGVASVGATGLLWAAALVGPWLLWVAAAALGASASAWNAVGMLTIVAEVDPAESGRASGLVLLAFYVGFVLSPVAFGAAVDATGRYGLGWAGVAACFAGATVTAAAWRRAR